MLKDYNKSLHTAKIPIKKKIIKKGTLAINVVETTPVVWHNELYRFE